MPQVVDDGGSIPPTRSNPWVVGSNPSLAAKSSLKNFIQLEGWQSGLLHRSCQFECSGGNLRSRITLTNRNLSDGDIRVGDGLLNHRNV